MRTVDLRPAAAIGLLGAVVAGWRLGIPGLLADAWASGGVAWASAALMALPVLAAGLAAAAAAWVIVAANTPAPPLDLGPELTELLRPRVPVEPSAELRLRGHPVVTDGAPLRANRIAD